MNGRERPNDRQVCFSPRGCPASVWSLSENGTDQHLLTQDERFLESQDFTLSSQHSQRCIFFYSSFLQIYSSLHWTVFLWILSIKTCFSQTPLHQIHQPTYQSILILSLMPTLILLRSSMTQQNFLQTRIQHSSQAYPKAWLLVQMWTTAISTTPFCRVLTWATVSRTRPIHMFLAIRWWSVLILGSKIRKTGY